MKPKNLWIITIVLSSLLLLASFSAEAADRTISDQREDVTSMDLLNTGESIVVTSSPFIEVDNIDITQATYTQQGSQVTVTLQVAGSIEDRGSISALINGMDDFTSFDAVEYTLEVLTSDQTYLITYANKTCTLTRGSETAVNLTDFSAVGDTITTSFQLDSTTEAYENLTVTSTYMKFNAEDYSDLVYLSDIAPNPPLEIFQAYAPNIGSVGETIQFNGSITPFTGQPPYTYNWDFGDQSTSTKLNPTHSYTQAGEFTYTFTVTDNSGVTASETGTITISSGGQNGNTNGSSSSPMILFLAVLAIIIVVGVIVIIWIIRR